MPDDSDQFEFLLRPTSPIEGADIQPLPLTGSGPFTIGRSSESDWRIPDQAVSRKHASIEKHDEQWFVTDLGSRHGTFLNGTKVEQGKRIPLAPGDRLRLGHWTCRFRLGGQDTIGRSTAFEEGGKASRISAIDSKALSGLAQIRLETLLDACRELNEAINQTVIANSVVNAAARATGCGRVLFVTPSGNGEFETVASSNDAPTRVSRSLVEAASDSGQLVELTSAGEMPSDGRSIMDLNIRAAICAPIMVGGSAEAFLYLDTRGAEGGLAQDAAAFCQSLAQLSGLAIERQLGAELADRQEQLERDLTAARRAQELLMPAPAGSIAGVSYAFESRAGRLVAGDLFDFIPLPEGKVGFFLGDVSGKGIGAAVLMSAAQSQLRTHLMAGVPVAEAVTRVSQDLAKRTDSDKFVTLAAGVIDPAESTLEIVDAGHGFCVLAQPEDEPALIDADGGLPMGVSDSSDYNSAIVRLLPGARIVLFSDGVVEQPDPRGEQYGDKRSLATIAGQTDPAETSRALLEAVREHAQGPLTDDLTVATIRLDD